MSELGLRATEGRCVSCNHVTVDAWLCDECSFGSDHYAATVFHDRRSSTPTKLSFWQQHRVDQAAAHEQLIQIQTVLDAGVCPKESENRTAPWHRKAASKHSENTAERNRSATFANVLSDSERSDRIRKMLHDSNAVRLSSRGRAIKAPAGVFNPQFRRRRAA